MEAPRPEGLLHGLGHLEVEGFPRLRVWTRDQWLITALFSLDGRPSPLRS